jgi:hypothetical protein
VKGARRKAQLGHDMDVVSVVERFRQVGVIVVDDCRRGVIVVMMVPGAGESG